MVETRYHTALEHSENVTLGKGKELTFVHCLPRSCWHLSNLLAVRALAARARSS